MCPKQHKRARIALTVVFLTVLVACGLAFAWETLYRAPNLKVANGQFLVEPYLQLGRKANILGPEILWAATGDASGWQAQAEIGKRWQPLPTSFKRVHYSNMPAFYIFSARLPWLPGDRSVAYQVLHNDVVVFSSDILPIVHPGLHYTVDVAGDLASGDGDELQIAQRMYATNPDLVVIPGDIVYPYGRSLEYLDHFFPVYNADAKTADGVPMLRHTLFVACPGNHDTAYGARHDTRDLNFFPDALGYFLWWRQPLGPRIQAIAGEAPLPYGSQQKLADFTSAAGDSYPREANYSFDFINSHWTVLDANPYMDWTRSSLRDWLEHDLDTAAGTWKFVVFHQTPFSSDQAHFNDQQMRVICDILQKYKVDVVFAGHVHNYQRTYPLKFNISKQPNGSWHRDNGAVDGTFELDKTFDGKTHTTPQAPIYITTGGGGASLYGVNIAQHRELWQPFTYKFISRHSLTNCDISGNHLHIKQIAEDGTILDDFSIDKAAN
jgi:predicted phosphodiesterase